MSLVPPLTTAEAAKLIDVRPGTLRQMRVRGTGPRFVKAGSRVRYDRADLTAWVGEKISSTASPSSDLYDSGWISDPVKGSCDDAGTIR